MDQIQFHRHNLTQDDISECVKVLNSLFLTTGNITAEFEKKLANFTNQKYASGLTSCTMALFLALKYYGIKEGDEVITTPLSFIATANVIEHCGAKPVFVDVLPTTGNIAPSKIEAAITEKTKAIIPVHLYGQLADMKRIRQIANKHNLKIIEDAAHSLESERDGYKVGELGDAACYSFYAIKNLACGEGGAITTNDENMYNWLKMARLHGMSKNAADRYSKKYEHYDMEILGYKCNLTNIEASLMIHQIDRLETYRQKKEEIAKKYDEGFSSNPNIQTPAVLPNSKHARHLYTIWVPSKKRDEIMHKIQEKNISIAVNFRPIHLMKYYKEKYNYTPDTFPITEKIGTSTISLPFYPKLTDKEITHIINSINEITS